MMRFEFALPLNRQCNETCVPLGNCSTTFAGAGLYELRIEKSEHLCSHHLEVCCSEKDIINGRPNEAQKRTFQHCGRRNVQGVGFRVVDAVPWGTQFGEFPWMVGLLEVKGQNNGKLDKWYFCGGSLIEPNVVVTAAHCVSKKQTADLIVRAGEWDASTVKEILPYQERRIDKIVIHENFNQSFLYNDIALLFLDEPFQPDEHIQLLCLSPQGKSFENAKNCIATGWGKTSFDSLGYSKILKKVQLPIVTHSECETALRLTRLGGTFNLHESFLCAGGETGVDTCTGDGGSPLVCPTDDDEDGRYQLAGIVAWGIGCSRTGIAGVYVNSSMYYDWIFRTTELYGLEKEEAKMEAQGMYKWASFW
ncbi:hypothetical protein pipiens_014232 [Culex pipiens pipiens]|uniref:Phenoloxidase-activating factor 2 n=1 Tax=Culex pipiens pipiens TaxID=38569 RepID=A0ABD1CVE8_CULPP